MNSTSGGFIIPEQISDIFKAALKEPKKAFVKKRTICGYYASIRKSWLRKYRKKMREEEFLNG